MFKDYLQLVRIPGIFTAFSNVLIGYFFSFVLTTDSFPIPFLLVTSGMLFSSGMILNDYFDIDIDKKERPNRPLASGKISKNNALFLAVLFIIIGNFFAILQGIDSLFLSLIMTVMILCYNKKLKFHSFIGIIFLSIIRFLNVILGFSILPLNIEIIQYAIPIGIFVAGISFLAKNEIHNTTSLPFKINKIFNIIVVANIFTLIILSSEFISLILLLLFILFSFNFISKNFSNKINIQKYITFQLLSIIFLDAAIIGITSIYFAILVSLLIIPSYFFVRKLYLT